MKKRLFSLALVLSLLSCSQYDGQTTQAHLETQLKNQKNRATQRNGLLMYENQKPSAYLNLDAKYQTDCVFDFASAAYQRQKFTLLSHGSEEGVNPFSGKKEEMETSNVYTYSKTNYSDWDCKNELMSVEAKGVFELNAARDQLVVALMQVSLTAKTKEIAEELSQSETCGMQWKKNQTRDVTQSGCVSLRQDFFINSLAVFDREIEITSVNESGSEQVDLYRLERKK